MYIYIKPYFKAKLNQHFKIGYVFVIFRNTIKCQINVKKMLSKYLYRPHYATNNTKQFKSGCSLALMPKLTAPGRKLKFGKGWKAHLFCQWLDLPTFKCSLYWNILYFKPTSHIIQKLNVCFWGSIKFNFHNIHKS